MKRIFCAILAVILILSSVPFSLADGENEGEEHIHTPAEAVEETVTPPDCTKKGEGATVIYCTECKEEISRETHDISATGHSFSDWAESIAPTCIAEGKETRSCENCGVAEERTTDTNENAHAFSEWETVKEATCTDAGSRKRVCTLCGKEESETVEKNPANHRGLTVIENKKNATCTEKGNTGDILCAECGAVITSGTEIDVKGHDWGDTQTVKISTCIQTGETAKKCSVCGETETETLEIDPENHTGETEIKDEKKASVEENGYTGDTYCADCGVLLIKGTETPRLHYVCDANGDGDLTVADARLILRAATGMNELTEGNDIYCDADGDRAITVGDARMALRFAVKLDETTADYREVTEYTAPTCAEYGRAKYTLDGQETKLTIPKKLHSYEVTQTFEPTCTESGLITSVCAVCGKENTEKTRATGHTPDKEADCTTPSVCTVCEAVISEPLGHDPVGATCTAAAKCSRCGISIGEPTGHNYTAATCEKAATCTVCGAVNGEKAGHRYAPATCERASTCTVCGATSGLPLGHNYSAATYAKPATCTRCGATKGDVLGVSYSSKGYKITTTADGFTYCDGLLIVNKTYTVPASYNPGGLTAECSAAFSRMVAGAKSYGISLWVQSGFRSYATQSGLYNRYVARDGKAAADTYSARPGHSEHQTGLGIDVNSVSSSFANTKEGIWLAAHCAEYGFIIRYPKGKQDKTGYMYEPWHIRYVGSVELAQKITKSGLCLEEYYGLTSQY